jgi:hypothetical protein
MARKLRASMTHEQLHDFASGSEQGKPEHVSTRPLHPALAARAQAVVQAHAHLAKTVPGFTAKPMREQMRMHQQHIRRGGQ